MSGKNKISLTEPKSTQTCTSGYTDSQVLPVTLCMHAHNLNLSVWLEIIKDKIVIKKEVFQKQYLYPGD